MDKREMRETNHVEAQGVVNDEEPSSLHPETALQRQLAALREDNEDLRASALWWKALYEEAQRRCADLESSPRASARNRSIHAVQ
jgi:hypothetical protein